MFSGIVEEMGVVKTCDRGLAGAKLTILAKTILQDLAIGDSVSVSGVCLTVVTKSDLDFSVDVSTETLQVTTIGTLSAGAPVNLERAMKIHARIGGHLVMGHVDGIGLIQDRQQLGNGLHVVIETSPEILRYCIQKGSITVDGISLTINSVSEKTFSVMIIPHTAQITTLGTKPPGETVNLEVDLIGKYVERLLQSSGYVSQKTAPVIDRDYFKKHGLL